MYIFKLKPPRDASKNVLCGRRNFAARKLRKPQSRARFGLGTRRRTEPPPLFSAVFYGFAPAYFADSICEPPPCVSDSRSAAARRCLRRSISKQRVFRGAFGVCLRKIRAKKSAAKLRRIFGNKAVLRATSFPFHRRIRPAAESCSSSGSSCRSSSGYTTTTRPTKPCSSQRR